MAKEETKPQELSRVASEAAERFGVEPVPLKKAIEAELQELVAKEIAEELFKARGGKEPKKGRATWGSRSRARRAD